MLSNRQKAAYDWFKRRYAELGSEAALNGGKLARHNWWRYQYYSSPYLVLERPEAITQRFSDVLLNTVDLSADGRLVPHPLLTDDGRFAQMFTEVIEETNWRGVLTPDLVARSNAPIGAYFESGEPLGVRLFGDRQTLGGCGLVKYSQREFVTQMYRHGRFRISPASFYARGSLLKAAKDFETTRQFYLRALNEALRGEEIVEVKGLKLRIANGVLPLQMEVVDYYLLSTCRDIDRRLPTDFEADAALVITDRGRFVDRLKAAMQRKFPTWDFLTREVYYYDPYTDIPRDRDQEFWKHFSFAYQKEHRCVLRRKYAHHDGSTLDPFFVELGSLDDIAEMVTLN